MLPEAVRADIRAMVKAASASTWSRPRDRPRGRHTDAGPCRLGHALPGEGV